jgi:D-alanyl-D-alanine dipeptidase
MPRRFLQSKGQAPQRCYDFAMRKLLPLVLSLLALPAAARELPGGFVYLRDIDSSIAQDMRYATYNNFTGRPLPGYNAAECILRRDVATALSKVQADLAKQQLSLKVYDCYRPRRAVAAMGRWANEKTREEPTKRFYPKTDRSQLFGRGYIAPQSAHSTGTAVDLTLVKLPIAPAAPFDRTAHYGACTGPAAERAPDNSLDMGTGYDCFDPKSFTRSGAISRGQMQERATLNDAMRRHGFVNYFREWWHFSYGARGPAQDFPIQPR